VVWANRISSDTTLSDFRTMLATVRKLVSRLEADESKPK
jgi:hypothetical protein